LISYYKVCFCFFEGAFIDLTYVWVSWVKEISSEEFSFENINDLTSSGGF